MRSVPPIAGIKTKIAALLEKPDKADGAPIRREGRADVRGRTGSKSRRCWRTDQLDIDIMVVLFFAVPGENYLVAVGRKTGAGSEPG